MIFSYYPGCSLETTASEYNESAQQVFSALGGVLNVLEDWNCCGATSAHSLSRPLAFLLPARNLSIAQEAGHDVVMPCAACFNRHKTVDSELRSLESRRSFVEEKLGFTYTGRVAVRPLLDVICRVIGLERVQARVSRPLNGLPVVSYYGCLLVRPAEITRFDDPENPVLLDGLLKALGAAPCPWSSATDCCGGGLAITASDLVERIVDRLVGRAREAGARAVVTSCPLCQLNLEMRQARSGLRLPVFYFTELMGLAFDLKGARSWWRKHLIDPTRLLDTFNLL